MSLTENKIPKSSLLEDIPKVPKQISNDIPPKTEDILKFGFIPEFVGRIASMVSLRDLMN